MTPEAEQQAQQLVQLAIRKNLSIDPLKLLGFARIKVAADGEVLSRSSADEHAKSAIYRRVASYYGLAFGNSGVDAIRQAAAKGRQAMSQIGQSANGARIALHRLSAVAEKNKNLTPPHFRQQLVAHNIPKMLASLERLERETQVHLGDRNVNPELAIRQDLKEHKSRLNRAEQTLVWWQVEVPRYSRKLKDMHELAKLWRLTACKDIETFRLRVAGLKKKAQFTGPSGRARLIACPIRTG
jgi:hypothetical protein